MVGHFFCQILVQFSEKYSNNFDFPKKYFQKWWRFCISKCHIIFNFTCLWIYFCIMTSLQYSRLQELFNRNMYGYFWLQARGKCSFGSWAVATPRHSSIKKRLWKRKETQHILLVLLGKENDIVLTRGYFEIHNELKIVIIWCVH